MKKRVEQITLKLKYILASLQRRRLNHVTFIGITGSAGKTTTKDLTATLLGRFAPCRQSFLSYNTLAAVAGTIWHTKRSYRYCIAEVSASGPGTMDLPLQLLKPDIAVVTRIGRDHYSAYKSMDALAAEKEKLVRALPPEGTAVLNMDDPRVRAMGERCNRRVIWFGETEGATLHLLEAHSRWPEPLTVIFAYQNKSYQVQTQLHGTYLATSVMASLGVALAANLPLEEAIAALAQAPPTEGRMQVVTGRDGVVFIRDDFKAPAWSLNAPLEFLKEARAERKVAIVGTISDASGDDTEKYKNFCRQIREYADLIVFIGPHAPRALRARVSDNDTAIQAFLCTRHAATYLQNELRKGDLVLLKGSNKADHLVRLLIDRNHPIQCWKDQCNVEVFCNQCPELYKPSRHISFSSPMALLTGPAVPVVVGLGNPGFRFRHTLHNVGYRVLDALVQTTGNDWEVQPEGWVSHIDLGGTVVSLLKPGTRMNINGAMIRPFLERMDSDPEHCIIIHGDADLSLGDIRLKSNGGDAGHKGVRSVIMSLGTENFPRIRLGVRRSGDTTKPERFVLTKFSKMEKAALDQMVKKAAERVSEYAQKHWTDKISE